MRSLCFYVTHREFLSHFVKDFLNHINRRSAADTSTTILALRQQKPIPRRAKK